MSFHHKEIFEVKLFKGAKSLEARDWIEKLELILELRNYKDERKFQIFPLFLKGNAIVWYDHLMKFSESKPTTWNDLKQRFLEKFIPEDSKSILKQDMLTRKQVNEPIENYLDHKFNLCLNFNPNMSFSEMKEYIIEGMKSEFKTQIIIKDPQNFKELTVLANEIEKSIQYSRSYDLLRKSKSHFQ